MSNQDKIYFSRAEYNKLVQIIKDNLNSRDKDISYRATRLSETFDKYVHFYEKQTAEGLEEGVIFIAYSNELK